MKTQATVCRLGTENVSEPTPVSLEPTTSTTRLQFALGVLISVEMTVVFVVLELVAATAFSQHLEIADIYWVN